jgi:DNA-binding NarL/FixJ family response regulator
VSMSATPVEHAARTVPRYLVAMSHPTTRRYVCDLIEQHCRCWIATTSPEAGPLSNALDDLYPDALIIEAATLTQAAPEIGERATHIVVIGPQPDPAYSDLAIEAGADAWVARDRLSTELLPALEHIQCDTDCRCGCHDHPHPEEASS